MVELCSRDLLEDGEGAADRLHAAASLAVFGVRFRDRKHGLRRGMRPLWVAFKNAGDGFGRRFQRMILKFWSFIV